MLKNNQEEQPTSYTSVINDTILAYNSIKIPDISEPTEQEQNELDQIDIDKIEQTDIQKMSNRKLIHFNNSLFINQKCYFYFGAHFITFFAANVYMAMNLRKHGKKFYSKASGLYRQIVLKGTLLSTSLYAYFLVGTYFIFKNEKPLQKSELRTQIYEELVQRNSLYDEECRQAMLANALKFYRFSPEYIEQTMNKIDDNLHKEFGDSANLYLEPI